MKELIMVFFFFACAHNYAVDSFTFKHASLSDTGANQVFIEAQDLFLQSGFLSFQNPSFQADLFLGLDSLSFSLGENVISYQHNGAGVLSSLNSVSGTGLNVNYQKEHLISLSSQSLQINLAKSQVNIPQFSLRCEKNYTKVLRDFGLCLEVAKFYAPIINLDQLTTQKLQEAFPLGETKGIKDLEEISISIFNGQVYLTFKARFLFQWKVKVLGNASFNQENMTLNLKINSAKVGILSIKRTLLKKLAEANIKNVQVVGDTIQLKI